MNPGSILIRATNWVGDAVMSLPAMRAVRDHFPHAHITVLARPWVAELYRREKFPSEVMLYTAGMKDGSWSDRLRFARGLRERRFEWAILFQNAFEAALIARLAGIPRRIGYNRDGRGLLLTDPIPAPRREETPPHEAYYYLELLRRAGLISQLFPVDSVRLEDAPAAREAGLRRFAALAMPGIVVGVSPGAAFGSAKRWLPERFAEAAATVASRCGASVALFGSAGERPLCENVAASLTGRMIPVRNLAGETTLVEFIELAAACRVFLTNDSGGMHIAAATGVPTVAVFGPTDHVATAPLSRLARIVREPLDCSPCKLRTCPIDHRCMTRIAAGQVAAATLELLK